MSSDYKLGLMYLVHLLIGVDGQIDQLEKAALEQIRQSEAVDDAIYSKFESDVISRKEREIYQQGIYHISNCTDEERLRAFAILYRLSEADGRIHVKEVRLLLYSIKMSGVEFDDVVKAAEKINVF
ncbi:MAG: hypothetical protein NZM13_06440 [Cyclobacteriaceae bacterium]|nr:hypothetical protein [Cyclobacteriaceae bacterium]MDW8330816.1 hypothetical protein [Cyclobacteriaceae bacterium]